MKQVISFNNKNIPLPEPCIIQYAGMRLYALEDSTVGIVNNNGPTMDIKYSLDEGNTWIQLGYNSNISVRQGRSICFKGNNKTYGTAWGDSQYNYFTMTGSFNLTGNLMSIIDDGELTTTTLSVPFAFLFKNCTSLKNAYEATLGVTNMTNKALLCKKLFENCSNLESAPEIPVTNIYSSWWMFQNCTSLNYIKCLATNNSGGSNTQNWTQNVAATGTFVKKTGSTWKNGRDGIPSGWTVIESND